MSGARSTEDDILNSIPDFADGGDDEASQSSSRATDDASVSQTDRQHGAAGEGSNASAQPTDTSGRGTGAQAGSDGGAGNVGTRGGTGAAGAIPRRHDGLVEVPSAQGNTRDLVDPTTGQIVARGGIERHVYEVGQRHARENVALKQQVEQFQRVAQGMNESARVARDLNLAPEHQTVAMRVMSDFMRDPVKTLEYLVAEVKSKGYNIPFLTEGVNPGIDLTAVQRLIETKMEPFTRVQQQVQEQEQARTRAQQTLDGFLGTYPEANHHLVVLTEMMQAAPDLTLHDAYLNLVSWSAKMGLDHTQPLAPQISARQQQQLQHTQPAQPAPSRQIPNGRSAMNGAASLSNAANFNENSSWSDIIRSAMEEAGSSP